MSFDRAKHNVSMMGERLNLGRGTIGVDGALATGRLVSFKGGDSRDVTVAVEAMRRFVKAGGDIILYHLGGDFEVVREGERVAKPATNLTMRRVSLAALVKAQGEAAWELGDRDGRFLFVRMDGKRPRLRVHWNGIPQSLWIDSRPVAFHGNDDLPGQVTHEVVAAQPIASSAGVCVFDSNLVTIDGEATKPMRTAEARILAAIIKANGEPVEACRQTMATMKRRLGRASTHVKTVRGKGYRWEA